MTVLNHRGNPAYGLTAAPPGVWEHQATCGIDPDLWHIGEWINWTTIAEARHICLHHCPVLAECRRDIGPMRSTVVGGVFYGKKGLPADLQPLAERCRLCTPRKAP